MKSVITTSLISVVIIAVITRLCQAVIHPLQGISPLLTVVLGLAVMYIIAFLGYCTPSYTISPSQENELYEGYQDEHLPTAEEYYSQQAEEHYAKEEQITLPANSSWLVVLPK